MLVVNAALLVLSLAGQIAKHGFGLVLPFYVDEENNPPIWYQAVVTGGRCSGDTPVVTTPGRWILRKRLTIGACLAAVFMALPAQAQDDRCSAGMVGTWLTTIQNGAGDYASRSLLTLHADGTVVSADSAQNQGLQGSSFSAQHGTWRCTSATGGSGTTLNFGFPNRESIARSDWTLSHDAASGALSGTISLFIFPGVKGVDPFRRDVKALDVFRFTAVRVGAPAK